MLFNTGRNLMAQENLDSVRVVGVKKGYQMVQIIITDEQLARAISNALKLFVTLVIPLQSENGVYIVRLSPDQLVEFNDFTRSGRKIPLKHNNQEYNLSFNIGK